MITAIAPFQPPRNTPDLAPERSGGPRTPEGKDASRRNSLKRGLRSKIVFPDDLAELVEQRVGDCFAEFTPQSPYEKMLVRDMAIASVRFERCASLSVADLIRVADRAELCWEFDRRVSVEDFAARLRNDPSRIALGLRRSRQGTDWLIDHWETLAAIARETGRWDDDQRRFAFNLLGVPRELRAGAAKVPHGDDAPKLIALAESQVATLRHLQAIVLDDLNHAERAMSMAGMPLAEDKATAQLRKDEARARNDFARARKELLRHRETEHQVEPRPKPETVGDRPALSHAAMDNLANRTTTCPMYIEEPEVIEAEESDEEVTSAPAEGRPNRRTRKEQARRERDAVRLGTG